MPQDGRSAHGAAVEAAKGLVGLLARRNRLAAFWRDVSELKARPSRAKRLLTYPNPGHWFLNTAHPLAARLLGSGLPPEVQAAYLASAVHSAANQMMARVTDQDDALFQEALALWCASEAT